MVSLAAAQRQAIGAAFRAGPDDHAIVAELLAGRLRLPPHPMWRLPQEPSWRENPFRDSEWQASYHSLQWLDPLRRADLAGDDVAAELWWYLARSWAEATDSGNVRTPPAWDMRTAVLRAIALACGLTVTGEQPWLVLVLKKHARWLADAIVPEPERYRPDRYEALFVLGTVLEDDDIRTRAVKRLGEVLERSCDEQGVYDDASPADQLALHLTWSRTFSRLDLEGVPRPESAARIERTPEFLAHATTPAGYLARLGETREVRPDEVGHPWTTFAATGGKHGRHPGSTSAVYNAGFAFLRSGWGEQRPLLDETWITVAWRPHGVQHKDAGGAGIAFTANRVDWLVDCGRLEGDEVCCRVTGLSQGNGWTALQISEKRGVGSVPRRTLLSAPRAKFMVVIDRASAIGSGARWTTGSGVGADRVADGFRLFSGSLECWVLPGNGTVGWSLHHMGDEGANSRNAGAIASLKIPYEAPARESVTVLAARDGAVAALIRDIDWLGVMDLGVDAMDRTVAEVEAADRFIPRSVIPGTGSRVQRISPNMLLVVVDNQLAVHAFHVHCDGILERKLPYTRRSNMLLWAPSEHHWSVKIYRKTANGKIVSKHLHEPSRNQSKVLE